MEKLLKIVLRFINTNSESTGLVKDYQLVFKLLNNLCELCYLLFEHN